MELEFDVLAPEGETRATVIWLHGMGQDSDSLIPVARQSDLPRAGVRNVFPRAPRQSLGLRGNERARAWFRQRIFALEHADLPTLLATESRLRDLVAAESAAAGSKRVLLAGFSQGAAMALIAGLRYPERLGGIILYDPYTPAELPLSSTRSPANADLPIWIGHGRYDWIVPAFVGEGVRDLLLSWGHPVSWREYHDYPNTHEPFSGAARDLRAFLDEVVAGGDGGG